MALLRDSAGPSLIRDFAVLQFQKDKKDAQELLKKVDADLDQKFSPEFKDRYQLESLLRELDVSIGAGRGGSGGSQRPCDIREGTCCQCRHLAWLSLW